MVCIAKAVFNDSNIKNKKKTYFESFYQCDSNQKNKSELIQVLSQKTAQQKKVLRVC
jgi:hypothetical protein